MMNYGWRKTGTREECVEIAARLIDDGIDPYLFPEGDGWVVAALPQGSQEAAATPLEQVMA